MLESRTISNTEYGDIVIQMYVCDWCSATTPQANPGPQWILVLTLNPHVDASVRLNNYFCTPDHAMRWKQAIDEYIASVGATPDYGTTPKITPPPPPPATPDITPDATPSDPPIDPV